MRLGGRAMKRILAACVALTALFSPATAFAAFTVSGGTAGVSPADPSTWSNSTTGYIGNTANGTLTVDGGSDLFSNGSCIGYTAGINGTVIISGVGSTWTDDGWDGVVVGYSGNGTLLIANGGSVSSCGGVIGNNPGSTSTVAVSGAGSKWTNSGSLWVGMSGSGTLNVTGGGSVVSSGGYIGYNSGSAGTVTIDGAGSVWSNSGDLNIGRNGCAGMLNITNNGSVGVTGTTYLATSTATINFGANGGTLATGSLCASPNQLTGTGTINACSLLSDVDLVFDSTHGLRQNLTWNSQGQNITINLDMSGGTKTNGLLGAGWSGAGSLTVKDGLAVASSSGYIGYWSTATGTVTVSGAGSSWTSTGSLFVGDNGGGTMVIANGGSVSNAGGLIGYQNGSTGTVLVSGAGSSWTNSGGLYVGNSGAGTMNVTGGGSVVSSGGNIGWNSGSTSTVAVSGTGSKWTNSGCLDVGNSGSGTLNVTGGGSVVSSGGYIGYNSGSAGTVTIDGAGSVWSNSGDLNIGRNGFAGMLNITNNGSVGVTGTTYLATSTATINFGANGGTLATGSLCASPNQLTGTGTINACSLLSDVDLVFDSTHGLRQNLTWNSQGQNITINLDMSGGTATNGVLGAGCNGAGSLTIRNGLAVASSSGYIGYNSGSAGTATVSGAGSTWTNIGNLYTGCAGNGTLYIDNGGSVSSVGFCVGCSGNGTLAITNGGTLRNTSSSGVASLSGSTGAVSVSGIGSLWTNSGSLTVGGYGFATMNITNGGAITSTYGCIGYYSSSNSTVTVSGAGSTWIDSGDLSIGNGTMGISAGGAVSNASGYVGSGFGGSPVTVTIDGAGSKWTNSGSLYVGYRSSGTVSVSNGGALSSGSDTYIGEYVYSGTTLKSMVAVSGTGSTWTNSGAIHVGCFFSSGTLNIANGAVVTSTYGYIGYGSSTAIGQATVSGAGSKWTITGASNSAVGCYVGFCGTGTLNITDSGAVSSSCSYIGWDGGSTGTATVNGAGSTWSNNNWFFVGYSGSGTLYINNGGAVSDAYGYIAFGGSSSGLVTLSGIGSTWTNSSDLLVGCGGSGTLNIVAGTVSDVNGSIGYNSGATGLVVVSGTGSKWTNTHSLDVGHYGTGTLYVNGGGAVTTGGSVSVSQYSLLSIDVGRGSSLAVGGGAGTISNAGTIRIVAGVGVAAGTTTYSPISAGTWTWSGTGTVQALGGTWNATSHRFTASSVTSVASGSAVSINLASTQRLLVSDSATGWAVGESFLATASASTLTSTATTVSGSTLTALGGSLTSGETVLSGWNLAATSGYTSGTPVYLSMGVGAAQLLADLEVWTYSGSAWSAYSAADLTYDRAYASWTVTALGTYAVTGDRVLAGDANRDGATDGADLGAVLANFGQSGATWAMGDFNGDGWVNGADLGVVLANFNQHLNSTSSSSAASAVPAPGTLGPLAIALLGLLACYIRRR